MNNLLERIVIDESICNGMPIIRGYRLTVQTILEFILAGSDNNEILEAYPFLEEQDIEACKVFALQVMGNQYKIIGVAA